MKTRRIILYIVTAAFLMGIAAYFAGADTFFSVPGPLQTKRELSVRVIDAITRESISGATVFIEEGIVCDAALGVPCGSPNAFTKKTDAEGEAIFDDIKFVEARKNNSLFINVYKEEYASGFQELPVTYKKKSMTIELVGGTAQIKNKGEAIAVALKNDEVTAWRMAHPHSTPFPKIEFSTPYWVIEYGDKTDCEKYNKKDRACALVIQIDARDGSLTIVY